MAFTQTALKAAKATAAAATSKPTSGSGTGGLSASGIAFFGTLCASTFGLGCWQTRRYFEKTELVALREEGLAAEPAPLGPGNATSSPENFRRVVVRGDFRHGDEVLVGPRGPPPGALAASGPSSGRSSGGMSSSPQGYFVITPLVRSDGTGTIIINRGWVPLKYVNQQKRWDRPRGTVEIVGVPTETEKPRFLSPPHAEPKKLLWMDRSALEAGTGTEGATPLLLTETSTDSNENVGAVTFPVKPNSEAVGEFKVTPPIHAGYALTWFSLSGAGLIMTRKLMTRGRG